MPSSNYTAAFANPKGPGDARPTAQQVLDDDNLRGQLSGKTILITGCTSGLGYESARALYTTGARIFITARKASRGQEVARKLATDPSRPIEVLEMELGSLDSIKAAAQDFLSKSSQLNVLITNAGVMASPLMKTDDGFELQFGSNHLGHFLLFHLLKDILINSSTPAFRSRVISVSSSGHRISNVHYDNYMFDNDPNDPYDNWQSYGQSKSANIHFANEIERRYSSLGLHALSLHPGGIMTPLVRHTEEDEIMQGMLNDERFKPIAKDEGQGAATQVWAAVAPELEGKGGLYLDDVMIAKKADPDLPVFTHGYGPHVYADVEGAKKLWTDSCKFVGVSETA